MMSRLSVRAGLAALMLLSLTCVGSGSTTAAAAQLAFPGQNGRIAYTLGGNVWTVQPDGTGKRQLTTTGRDFTPRWSADGRRIAFMRAKNIWVMNADGSGKRQVTAAGKDLQPAWSPDGRQFVFIRLQANGRGDLFRMPSAGGAVIRVTNDAASSGGNDVPTWSPLGGVVLFLHYQQPGKGNAVIKTVTVATGQQRVVPAGVKVSAEDSVADPDFESDGRHVLFRAACLDVDNCYPANMNVMYADLTSPSRDARTTWSGIESELEKPTDVAASPAGVNVSPYFALEMCDDFNFTTGGYDFCGIRPGNVNGARDPDWQPLP